MNPLNSYATGTAFDTAFDDELYSECPGRPYLAETWATQLCEAPSNFFDPLLDASAAQYDLTSDFLPRSLEALANASAVAANVGVCSLQIPPPAGASLRRVSSTPSPSSDKPLNSPSYSTGLESPSRVSTDAEHDEPTPKRRMKKRGRPKLDPIALSISDASAEGQRTAPIPHNKVERKYREGLNAELERLRRAVPTLLQSHNGSGIGQPKPSKSIVIAAAINHIGMVTQERNMLQSENDEIREYREDISEHRDETGEEIGENMGEIRTEKSGLKGGRWSKKRRVGLGSE
jgi:hypothetical protein